MNVTLWSSTIVRDQSPITLCVLVQEGILVCACHFHRTCLAPCVCLFEHCLCCGVVDRWDGVSFGDGGKTENSQLCILVERSHSRVLDCGTDLLEDLFSCIVSLFSKHTQKHALHLSQSATCEELRLNATAVKIQFIQSQIFLTLQSTPACVFSVVLLCLCRWKRMIINRE